jgi:hypothetical protein
MVTNQESLQTSIRLITGTSGTIDEDWMELFDDYSIASGSFNERMMLWLQSALNSSETNINALKQLYADSLGVYNWNSVYTIGHALPDQQLRLDAGDTGTITDTTGNVTLWGDKSGNGYNATTDFGTPRTGDSTENGLNIIDFTSDRLFLPSALYAIPNGNNTAFVVSKRASEDGSLDSTIGAATGVTNEYFHTYSNVAGSQLFTNKSGGGGSATFAGATNTALNIATMRRDGTTQGISVDGDTEVTKTSATSSATIDDFFIGTAGSGAFPLNGSIAEIIIYDRALSANERAVVNQYLANKWGITLV